AYGMAWHYDRPYDATNLSSQRLLFPQSATNQIYEIPLDGSPPVAYNRLIDEVNISPNGDELVYNIGQTGYKCTYSSGNFGPQIPLGVTGCSFEFSPTGDRLVFDRQGGTAGVLDLWIADADGSNARLLTDGLAHQDDASWGR
ncbi:MAG: hypothetical protein KC910_14100, partial [Candidatus Eremiobacteraeota bacterium]|nr:hypothetical protein [Candidatus Eremiobacteraeota bacterium]